MSYYTTHTNYNRQEAHQEAQRRQYAEESAGSVRSDVEEIYYE